MASDNYPHDLSITWPFRTAGTLVMVALAWFCAGFALEDIEEPLPNHLEIFFLLLAVSLVFVVGGAIYNTRLGRKRQQRLG